MKLGSLWGRQSWGTGGVSYEGWKEKGRKGEEVRGDGWEDDSLKTSSFRLVMSKHQTRDRTELQRGKPDEWAELLGSSCVQSSQCANIILFQVVRTWKSYTFQIKHKYKQPSLNSSDLVPIKSVKFRELNASLGQWIYSKQFLKEIWTT